MPTQGMLRTSNESYWDDFGGVVLCPVCGFDYVHMNGVEIDQGASIATVDGDGCRLTARAKERITQRGSQVTLWMNCESGHTFAQVFRFHKGMTFVRVERDVAPSDQHPGLWRD